MKCVFQIMIFLMLAGTANAGSGPCSRKLLATGDRVQDTIQFTTYLESLIDKRIVSLSDLEPFLKELELGKLTNPMPNSKANKFLVFWHTEFQKLIHTNAIDIDSIIKWTIEYLHQQKEKRNQKQKTEKSTKEIPVGISHDGSMFYKINDPTLGEALRILKPGGHFENDEDWEKTIWAISPLKSKDEKILEFTNDGEIDLSQPKKVSRNSPARKACLDLGDGGADLPTMEDYYNLIEHFEHSKGSDHRILTPNGLLLLQKIFLDAFNHKLWSASVDPNNNHEASPFYAFYEKKYFHHRNDALPVLCIKTL